MTQQSKERIAKMQASQASRPHGTRSRYTCGKCRCTECRRANADYEHSQMKRRIFHGADPFVAPDAAREHVLYLRGRGVGYKVVADAANVPSSSVHKIIKGERNRILKSTETALLSVTVDAIEGGARIPAGPTWKILNRLISAGYTKTQIARWLGIGISLQISKNLVTVRNARKVERLAEKLDAGMIQRPSVMTATQHTLRTGDAR
jgi:hypothetical protein